MIRKDFVNRKVSLIQNDLIKLSELSNYSLDEVVQDFLKATTVERLLERIINRAIDINQHIVAEVVNNGEPPRDYTETFLKLAEFGVYPKEFAEKISKSVATRNILAHDYDKVDYSLIYESIKDCLGDYTAYCDYILGFSEKV